MTTPPCLSLPSRPASALVSRYDPILHRRLAAGVCTAGATGTSKWAPPVHPSVRSVSGHPVFGVDVDPETRCGHYAADRDVVAFRFDCCDGFYPCFRCHEAVTDHEAAPWPRDRFDDPAVLCGACGTTLTVAAYLECDHACPSCGAAFNPGCVRHRDRYFERD